MISIFIAFSNHHIFLNGSQNIGVSYKLLVFETLKYSTLLTKLVLGWSLEESEF